MTQEAYVKHIQAIKQLVNTPWEEQPMSIKEAIDSMPDTSDDIVQVESEIYVPVVTTIPNYSAIRRQFENDLLNIFDGWTSRYSNGAWRDDKGDVHYDDLHIYTVKHGKHRAYGELHNLAYTIGTKLKQDCVYLNYQGNVYFVDTKGEPKHD